MTGRIKRDLVDLIYLAIYVLAVVGYSFIVVLVVKALMKYVGS